MGTVSSVFPTTKKKTRMMRWRFTRVEASLALYSRYRHGVSGWQISKTYELDLAETSYNVKMLHKKQSNLYNSYVGVLSGCTPLDSTWWGQMF